MPLDEPDLKFFRGPCDFFWGADSPEKLPPMDLPEIAFAGRSNVGKSSLINALTERKTLARTSQTPGRTQQLNFFNLGGRLVLVDMPGYGFAKVSKAQKADWEHLIRTYLRGRRTLACVFLLIDSRHGLKESDIEIMKMLDSCAVLYRIILTKADKAAGLPDTIAAIEKTLTQHTAAFPHIMATSAEEKTGVTDLQAVVIKYALNG